MELVEKYDFIKERRGLGLMLGLEFDHPVKPYIQKALDKGLVLITGGMPNNVAATLKKYLMR